MAAEFDAHAEDYVEKIEKSVRFSGAEHSFFIEEKARILRRIIRSRFGSDKVDALDVGCGLTIIRPLKLAVCEVAENPRVDELTEFLPPACAQFEHELAPGRAK